MLDNKSREQQRLGRHVVSHNILSREDLRKLYQSNSLSSDTPSGLLARLVFTVGILTAMRPSALVSLKTTQFTKSVTRDRAVWFITAAVGSDIGGSKTSRGGWAAIGNKVPEIPVFDESYEDGAINFFKDIDDYMSLRSRLETGSERFFMSVNPAATNRRDFLRRQHVGKNKFMSIVKNVCIAEKIEGSGQKNWVTTHGLRGTLATLLFQSGHSDSSVALRTGHRDPKSLKSYQNLQCENGLKQQRDLLGALASPVGSSTCDKEKDDADQFTSGTSGEHRFPATHFGTINGSTINLTVNVYQKGQSF